jgi:DNA-binding XRE family transcriptional regulator
LPLRFVVESALNNFQVRKPCIPRILLHLLRWSRLAKLIAKVDKPLIFDNMNHSNLASYLRSHRKRSGLSQREVGQLLGYPDQGSVSRHERLCCVPPLMTALGYQAIFHQPISELFPGAYESTRRVIEERLEKLKDDLHQRNAKGRTAAMIARKLEWMWERENPEQSDSTHGPEAV